MWIMCAKVDLCVKEGTSWIETLVAETNLDLCEELPVKGTKITGTMRPTKNRFGQIHVVLAFLRRSERWEWENG